MTQYELKEGERFVMEATIREKDKVLNQITIYEDADRKIYVHNSNGIKQDVCPLLRYSGIFYCSKYADITPQVDCSHWDIQSCSSGIAIRNPQYKSCHELGGKPEDYIKCKYYKLESEGENE